MQLVYYDAPQGLSDAADSEKGASSAHSARLIRVGWINSEVGRMNMNKWGFHTKLFVFFFAAAIVLLATGSMTIALASLLASLLPLILLLRFMTNFHKYHSAICSCGHKRSRHAMRSLDKAEISYSKKNQMLYVMTDSKTLKNHATVMLKLAEFCKLSWAE